MTPGNGDGGLGSTPDPRNDNNTVTPAATTLLEHDHRTADSRARRAAMRVALDAHRRGDEAAARLARWLAGAA